MARALTPTQTSCGVCCLPVSFDSLCAWRGSQPVQDGVPHSNRASSCFDGGLLIDACGLDCVADVTGLKF